MSAKGTGRLHFVEGIVNAEKYIQILQTYLKPTIEECKNDGMQFTFQQDGAACHTAKKVKQWLLENEIPVLSWTSSSPDLSPIETLWHIMKKRLRAHPARTLPDLRSRIQDIWDSFTTDECKDLVNTMPRRIEAVLKRKGDVTQW